MKYVLVLLLLSLAIACDDGQSDTSAPQDPAKQLVAEDESDDAADKEEDKSAGNSDEAKAEGPSVGGAASFSFSTGDKFTGALDLGNTTVGTPDNGNAFSGAIAAGAIFSGRPAIASASGASSSGMSAEGSSAAACLKDSFPANEEVYTIKSATCEKVEIEVKNPIGGTIPVSYKLKGGTSLEVGVNGTTCNVDMKDVGASMSKIMLGQGC